MSKKLPDIKWISDNTSTCTKTKAKRTKPTWIASSSISVSSNYFVLPKDDNQLVIVYEDNKFTTNNASRMQNGDINTYWRCNQYRKNCLAKFITVHKANNETTITHPYGFIKIDSVYNTHNHDSMWNTTQATKQWFIDQLKNEVATGLSPKDAYDTLSLTYPQASLFVPHFQNVKNQVYYSRQKTYPKLPRTQQEVTKIFEDTKYSLTYFSRQKLEADEVRDNDIEMEKQRKSTNSTQNDKYHPQQNFDKATASYVNANNQLRQIQDTNKKLHSQILSHQLPNKFFGSIYCGTTTQGSIVLGGAYGQYIMSKCKRMNIDGTFPTIVCSSLAKSFG